MRDYKNNLYQIDPIDNVPVVLPCAAGFELKFLIQKGDGCLLVFSEMPLGNYLNIKGQLNTVDADDMTKFDLTDCIAIPGLYPFSKVPTPNNYIEIDDSDNITIQSDTGSILQQTTSGKVEVDSAGNIVFNDGTESYVLGDSFETAMTTVINLLIGHTHDVIGVQAGASTITSSVSAALAALSNPVTGNLSTQIKGK